MNVRPELNVVDDNPEIRNILREPANPAHCAQSGRRFFEQYRQGGPAINWLDIVMPGQDGIVVRSRPRRGGRGPQAVPS